MWPLGTVCPVPEMGTRLDSSCETWPEEQEWASRAASREPRACRVDEPRGRNKRNHSKQHQQHPPGVMSFHVLLVGMGLGGTRGSEELKPGSILLSGNETLMSEQSPEKAVAKRTTRRGDSP